MQFSTSIPPLPAPTNALRQDLLTTIWYTAVYTVRLNLEEEYFGAILVRFLMGCGCCTSISIPLAERRSTEGIEFHGLAMRT